MKPEPGQIIYTLFDDGEIALQGPIGHFLCNGDELMGVAATGQPFTPNVAALRCDIGLCGGEGFGPNGPKPPIDVTPVPVPAAGWLFATLLIGLAAVARRRDQSFGR